MNGIYAVLAAVIAILGLTYLEANIKIWTLAVFLGALALSFTGIGYIGLTITWLIFIIFLLFSLPFVRRSYFTKPILHWFENNLPAMSRTEEEAIEAGDVWLEGPLFQGKPDWKTLYSLKKPTLSTEEESFLQNEVEILCKKLDDWEITHKRLDLPNEVWDYLKQAKFFGIIIPKKYGGLGFSSLGSSTIVQKIATRSLTAAVTMMVPNSLGPGELLVHYGTDEQKEYYLPRLASGEEIPCFALTGPEAGSDASSIPDHGEVTKIMWKGKETIGIKLNFNKRYITLAPIATVIGLAFKLYDPHNLLKREKIIGITVCLIPAHHEGIEIGTRHFACNQPFMNGPIRGKDVLIPMDFVVGGEKMIGLGWRMLVECLSAGRGISLPALSAATSKHCYRTSGAYAKIRKQFHVSIGHFEGVEAVLGKIAGLTYLIEATRLLTLLAIDSQVKPSVVTAIAKYHMTELSRLTAFGAMDIHAGKGIMLGPKNYLARCYQSMPISVTVEGANILTRNLIIFGQGAIRCHPYLINMMKAVHNPDKEKGLLAFDRILGKHIARVLSNVIAFLGNSITAGKLGTVPKPKHKNKNTSLPSHYAISAHYFKAIQRMSLAFAVVSEIALSLLGGKLKRKERLSARLGDILSYLYMAMAVCKYYEDCSQKEPKACSQKKPEAFSPKEADGYHVEWCLQFCLYRIQKAFLAIFENFPILWLGKLLKWLVFPYGRPYHKPNDYLEHKLAKEMQLGSSFRERMVQNTYVGSKDNSSIAILEEAFKLMLLNEPTVHRLESALKGHTHYKHLDFEAKIEMGLENKIISLEEAEALRQLEAMRMNAIAVDEFTQSELTGV